MVSFLCVFGWTDDGGVKKKLLWDKKRIEEDNCQKRPLESSVKKKERGNITYHTPREIHTRLKKI